MLAWSPAFPELVSTANSSHGEGYGLVVEKFGLCT
jgi:hypothetical protein